MRNKGGMGVYLYLFLILGDYLSLFHEGIINEL
jgi:hypothetical protein